METNLNLNLEKRVKQFLEQDEENQAVKDFERRTHIARSISDKLKASLKPAGYYNIPEILDKRRLEYGIPNGAFEVFPSFDRVFIHQIPMKQRETYTEGGKILMPDARKSWEKNTAPKGILVAAGLKARDALSSTGVEVGDIVCFKKFSPFILPIDEIDGYELAIMVLRDGDVEGSYDLATKYNNKQVEIKNVSESGYDYRFVDSVTGSVTGNKVDEYYDASI